MAEQNTHTRGAVKDPEHDGRLKETAKRAFTRATSSFQSKAVYQLRFGQWLYSPRPSAMAILGGKRSNF
jgi:hypothetical protein